MSVTVQHADDGIYVITWVGLSETAPADKGSPARIPYPCRAIQATGAFGDAGKIVVEGSNDLTTWSPLTADGSTAIEFSSAGIKRIHEPCIYIRPRVSAGSGVSATVILNALPRP